MSWMPPVRVNYYDLGNGSARLSIHVGCVCIYMHDYDSPDECVGDTLIALEGGDGIRKWIEIGWPGNLIKDADWRAWLSSSEHANVKTYPHSSDAFVWNRTMDKYINHLCETLTWRNDTELRDIDSLEIDSDFGVAYVADMKKKLKEKMWYKVTK